MTHLTIMIMIQMLMGNLFLSLDDISLNSTEFEYDSDSISNDIKIEDFDIAEEEDATRSKSPSKLEKIADLL